MLKADKKMAAAIAAVNCYLQEEAMNQAAALETASGVEAGPCLNQASQWALATRLEMMTSNRMLAQRAFSRTR